MTLFRFYSKKDGGLGCLTPVRESVLRTTGSRGRALGLALFCALAGPARSADLKIATWNLNWLTLRQTGDPALPADVRTRRPEDFARLQAYANHLSADVIAFQEVDGPTAAAQVFDPARYTILTIDEDVIQRVGLAVRREIAIERHPDVTALDAEPYAKHRLRDGLDVTLQPPGAKPFRVLVVHLKTGCQFDPIPASRRPECALVAQQIPVLAAWAAARQAEGVPFAIMGDFNRVLDEPETLGAALADAAPLTRADSGYSDPCWDGGAFIDHIFLGGAARTWLIPGSLRVMTYRETAPSWKARLSDHCPVSVRLHLP